jgi:hypothetical protein
MRKIIGIVAIAIAASICQPAVSEAGRGPAGRQPIRIQTAPVLMGTQVPRTNGSKGQSIGRLVEHARAILNEAVLTHLLAAAL